MSKKGCEIRDKPRVNQAPNLAILITLATVMARVVIPQFRALAETTVIEPFGLKDSAADNMGYRPFMLLGMTFACLVADVGVAVVMRWLQLAVALIGLHYPGIHKVVDDALKWLFEYDQGYVSLDGQSRSSDEVLPLERRISSRSALHDIFFVAMPRLAGTLRMHLNSGFAATLPMGVEWLVRQIKEREIEQQIERTGHTNITPEMINADAEYYGKLAFGLATVVLFLNYLDAQGRSVFRPTYGEQQSPRTFPHSPGRSAPLTQQVSYLIRLAAAVTFKVPDAVVARASSMFRLPPVRVESPSSRPALPASLPS